MKALQVALHLMVPCCAGADTSQEFQSSTIPHGGPLAPAPPPDAPSQPQSQPARRISEPEEEEELEEQAAAAHVLICCDTSLRLYPAEGIRLCDRCPAPHATPHAIDPPIVCSCSCLPCNPYRILSCTCTPTSAPCTGSLCLHAHLQPHSAPDAFVLSSLPRC